MANNGVKMSDFTQLSQVANGDKIIMLHNGNAQADYSVVANAIIDKMKRENVVTTQTNNNNKIPSAGLVYGMNETIEDLQESTSTEQEEKSVTAKIATVDDADGGDAGLTLNLEPHQAGSGDPSPDNVRPITGWTGAKVTRTGKNLLDYLSCIGVGARNNSESIYSNTSTSVSGDILTIKQTYRENGGVLKGIQHPVLPEGTTFTVRLEGRCTGDQITIGYGKYEGGGTNQTSSQNVTPNVWTTITRIFTAQGGAIALFVQPTKKGALLDVRNLQLELGSTATDYEPYSGQTYDITFPSEAGTVYGGTLDVTNGVLTVDRAQIASYAGETLPSTWISDRDVYSAGATPTTGAQVVYELATPITYQLTPIEVTTLLGDNTIWMDAEGTIKLDYKTNAIATKGDVNEAIARIKALAKIAEAIAPVESSYTATQNYSVGDYLIVDYKLYKVTATIANGGTITPNTNVTATTIMAEIKALA